jgi:membrane protein implicated in regulation of membrane protease activity
VITEGDFIAAGESLEILRLDGNKIVVRKVASP